MSSGGNGDLHTPITRRVRADPQRRADGDLPGLGPRHSGRAFVIAAGVALGVIGALLYAAFLHWRATHRELAAFGRDEVAATIAPLSEIEPPGVDAGPWRSAVADTRAMIEAVTASGALDRPRSEALRDELRGRVADATPQTAVAVLRSIWDDLERRAGPVATREFLRPPHPPRRPAILRDGAPGAGPAPASR
jgi:hypothetical protein